MDVDLQTLSRCRPRCLTFIVLFFAAAVTVLANLSFDEASACDGDVRYRSFGWPLIWNRTVQGWIWLKGRHTIGWYYSFPKLAANLAMWLLLLTVPSGGCEWLLRKYRPRPRWSVRAMFLGVGLAAVICGGLAKARFRANLQDPIVDAMANDPDLSVFVERSGPKWLDLLGADRFRQRILAVRYVLDAANPQDEEFFRRLSRLPDLRHLLILVDELSPAMAESLRRMQRLETFEIHFDRLTPDVALALRELRQLRSLSIKQRRSKVAPYSEATRYLRDCFAAVGELPDLEELDLLDVELDGECLVRLAGVKKLKSLNINFVNSRARPAPNFEHCLTVIGKLSQLESLQLTELNVNNDSLSHLADLPNLKTLILDRLFSDGRPKLTHLPPLMRLEALKVSRSFLDDDHLGRLGEMPCLKTLGLDQCFIPEDRLITPASLRELSLVASLEAVELDGRIESPAGIEALAAVKRLKTLYLGDELSAKGENPGAITLDDGEMLLVRDVEGFRRALSALRQAKPGVAVNGHGSPAFSRRRRYLPRDYGYGVNYYDRSPTHRPSWLPGSGDVWMTRAERAAFEKAGGQASFDGITWPDRNSKILVIARF